MPAAVWLSKVRQARPSIVAEGHADPGRRVLRPGGGELRLQRLGQLAARDHRAALDGEGPAAPARAGSARRPGRAARSQPAPSATATQAARAAVAGGRRKRHSSPASTGGAPVPLPRRSGCNERASRSRRRCCCSSRARSAGSSATARSTRARSISSSSPSTKAISMSSSIVIMPPPASGPAPGARASAARSACPSECRAARPPPDRRAPRPGRARSPRAARGDSVAIARSTACISAFASISFCMSTPTNLPVLLGREGAGATRAAAHLVDPAVAHDPHHPRIQSRSRRPLALRLQGPLQRHLQTDRRRPPHRGQAHAQTGAAGAAASAARARMPATGELLV